MFFAFLFCFVFGSFVIYVSQLLTIADGCPPDSVFGHVLQELAPRDIVDLGQVDLDRRRFLEPDDAHPLSFPGHPQQVVGRRLHVIIIIQTDIIMFRLTSSY